MDRLGTCSKAVAIGISAVGLAGPASGATQQEDDVNGIIPYPFEVTTLDNGLKIILMQMPSNGLVTYWSIVRTGSGHEFEPGRTGFAHFFEHMMFRGTEKYPTDLYQQILTKIGADANAYTTDDLTAYHLTVTAEDLDQVVELESDRFMHLAYSKQDFETEAGAVFGEYRKSKTDPLFALYEQMLGAAFTRHPYGHTTLGFERDIAAMPEMYDYSRDFFSRYYRPENTILFVAGEFDRDAALATIESHYSSWQRGYVEPDVPDEPEQRGQREVRVSYAGESLPIAWISYKLDRFDPDNEARVAADLLADLAFGPTSDVYRRLVLDEQAVEFLSAGAHASRDPGLFDIYTRVKDPGKVDYVLEVIDATIEAYRSRVPSSTRLNALKSRLKYGFLMGLETPDSVAQRVARGIALGGGVETVDALYAAYGAVTREDVQGAARAYWHADRRTVGVLRPAR